MPGPLDGIRVIDLGSLIAGPMTTTLLGDQESVLTRRCQHLDGTGKPVHDHFPIEWRPIQRFHRRVTEGPREHGGHLGAGEDPIRTESIVVRWIAALGYPDLGNPVDRSLQNMAVIIDEVIRRG